MFKDKSTSSLEFLKEYQSQLEEVTLALETVSSEEDRVQLEEIQSNLMTLLELSLSQIESSSTSSSKKVSTKNEKQLEGNDEYEKFQMEMAALGALSGEGSSENPESLTSDGGDQISALLTSDGGDNISDLPTPAAEAKAKPALSSDFESELKSLEGESVRAPFKEKWGGFTYHNGVVLSVCEQDLSGDSSLQEPQVLVLFSQPTSVAMLPCKFFLEGRCQFMEKGCKFSHGEKVLVKDLKDFREPDTGWVTQGKKVLALHDKFDLWHRGSVEDVAQEENVSSMNCAVCGDVVEVDLKNLVPVDEDSENPITSDVSTKSHLAKDLTSTDDGPAVFIPNEVWSNISSCAKLGSWEQYTKGIGSKLMSQMGYVVGTGLGPKGLGRVEPVETLVYPQGVSLDFCKKLRESAGGDCLLSVEKRMLKQAKKLQEKQDRRNATLPQSTSVFDIINTKLSDRQSDNVSATSSSRVDVSRVALKKDTTKELNRKSFQLSSSMDKLKSEISSLNQSKIRHCNDPVVLSSIDRKLAEKSRKLADMKTAESQIDFEKSNRKDLRKWSVF